MQAKPLETLTGKELLALDVEPPKFIVSRFLPAGLHMLAGSPKIGKSWLALWLCHQVSQGAPVFMEQKVGKENIIVAIVHEDEANPHMHLCFVPLTQDKRLSAKEILGNRKDMCRWQDEYYAHMSARFPLLERGEPAQETERKHQTVQQFKQTHPSPEYAQLWRQHERLKRYWHQVPYKMREDIVERERAKKQERTMGAR